MKDVPLPPVVRPPCPPLTLAQIQRLLDLVEIWEMPVNGDRNSPYGQAVLECGRQLKSLVESMS